MRTRRVTLVFPLILLVLWSVTVAWAQPSAVPPGGVVRWPGADLEACGLNGRQWSPRQDACWYPIDLLAQGSLTLERWVEEGHQTREVRVADYPYDVQRITIEDDSRVNLSPENVERANRESARIRPLWVREGGQPFTLPLGPPLENLPEGGRFGARRIINGQPKNPHTGADFAADEGTAILAVAAGKVVLAEEHFFAGNSVFIDHGDGLISMSFHMSRIDVSAGDRVERGQTIGAVGATGRATGPHLHFGLRWHGWRVDPAELIGAASDVQVID